MLALAFTLLASVLPITVATDSGDLHGSCVVVQVQAHDDQATLYVLTSARLFRDAEGVRHAIRSIAIDRIPISPHDVILPAATIVDIAIVSATVPSTALAPQPLSFSPPSTSESFRIVGAPGGLEQITERIRFQSTLLVVGDTDASGLTGCLGAPALNAAGVFGIVTDCRPNKAPTIALLSIAQPFLAEHIPGIAPSIRTTMGRNVFGPTILVPCGELRSGDVDVPFEKNPTDVPVFATASFVQPESIRLAEVTVLTLDDRTVRLRFTLAGTPPPPYATTCQPGQALVTVRIDLVNEGRTDK